MVKPGHKECNRCKRIKSFKDFRKDKHGKHGVQSVCKVCRSIHQQKTKHSLASRIRSYKAGAKRRSLVFDISLKDFDEITKKPCVYCGDYSESADEVFCGLDRIDPAMGYTKKNVVPCCWKCNDMKGIFSTEEFLERIKKIYEKRLK